MKKQSRFLSLVLCFIVLFSLLCSCAPRPLAQSSLASTEVGKVVGGSEEYTIDYEEFYPLAYDAYQIAKAKYGDDTEAIEKEAWETVKKNIVITSAKIELCKSEGLEYNESELRDRVNKAIEDEVTSIYDGNYAEFRERQDEIGYTDHYMRYLMGVEFLYSDLALEYQKNGTVPNSDEKIIAYVKENFVHTWHAVIYVEEGDDRDAEYERAKEALKLLQSGISMRELIGGSVNGKIYNENLAGDPLNNVWGYYSPIGTMNADYEEAALSVKPGTAYGDVVVTKEISPLSGELIECFYIIERLPITTAEIEDNLNTLSDDVKRSIVSKKLDDTIKDFSFEPNEYAKGLNFASLEVPTNGIDYQLVIGICVGVGSIIILVAIILTYRILRAKRFQKKLKQKHNASTDKNKINGKANDSGKKKKKK